MTDFRINVIVDPSQARTGNKVVRGELQRTGSAADRLRNTLVKTFAILGVAGGIAGSIRLLADFGQEMSTVRAITGATEQQFQALREEALRLGTTTRFSATQAAEGLTFLARAGFTAEEALQAVEGTLQLAQAGGLDLGSAADIASNALTGFRLGVDQTARVVDTLALAANSSNTNVFQLGDALKFVAPVAAGVGVEIEEATAAIGALSDAGLQASLAGTGLRRILSELESPASKTRQVLQDLGLSADDVRISQVGLTQALKNLREAGVDTGLALEIFGDRGGPAFEVLSTSIPKVEEMTVALGKADGTAARVAETMDQNLNGALLAVRSAYEGFILALGDTGSTTALTKSLLLLATALRFLAENAEAVAVVVSFLVATVFSAAIAGFAATAGGAAALSAALAVSPFTFYATTVVAAFTAVKKFTDGLSELEETLKQSEGVLAGGASQYAAFGDIALNAEKQVAMLQARIDSGDENPAIVKQIANLTEKIRFYRGEQEKLVGSTDAARRAQEAQADAVASVNKSFEEQIRQLDAEAEVLLKSNKEREIATELLKLENALRKEGAGATPEQLMELEALVERNQALRDQARALDEIRGPAQDAADQNAALNVLLETGRITTEEYTQAIKDLNSEFDGFDLTLPDIPDFSAPDLSVPGAPAVGGTPGQPFATEEISAYQQILNDLTASQDRFNEGQQALGQLLQEGTISLGEYNVAMAQLTIESERAGTSISSGFASGLATIKADIFDLASATKNTLVNAFNGAEDALVSFVTTGEADMSALVDSILADLTRLLARQALIGLINSFTGGAGGALSSIPGFATGTSSTPANEPIIVGEEGPEIFNPKTSGAVIPNDQTMAALGGGQGTAPVVNVAAPNVTVPITNVSDPSEIPAALETEEGQQAVLNVMRRNPDASQKF